MKLFELVFNRKAKSEKEATKTAIPEFYLFECWNQYADVPENLLPFVDTVKTKEEWENLGFPMVYNSNGQIRKIKVNNKYFSFIRVEPNRGDEAEAIKTGKKLTYNVQHIRMLLQRGCRPEEFLRNPSSS